MYSLTNFSVMEFLQIKQIYGPTKCCQTVFIGFNYLITVFWKMNFFFQPFRHDTFKTARFTYAQVSILKFYHDIAGFTKLFDNSNFCQNLAPVLNSWHEDILAFMAFMEYDPQLSLIFFRAKFYIWVLEKYWTHILCPLLFSFDIPSFRDSQNVGCVYILCPFINYHKFWATDLESSA